MRIEHYPDLFKLKTYRIFIASLLAIIGIKMFPYLQESYKSLLLIYYRRNKEKLVFNKDTLTYSYK